MVKIKSKILEVYLQSINLRNVICYSVSISDFGLEIYEKLKKKHCTCLGVVREFDSKISTSP